MAHSGLEPPHIAERAASVHQLRPAWTNKAHTNFGAPMEALIERCWAHNPLARPAFGGPDGICEQLAKLDELFVVRAAARAARSLPPAGCTSVRRNGACRLPVCALRHCWRHCRQNLALVCAANVPRPSEERDSSLLFWECVRSLKRVHADPAWVPQAKTPRLASFFSSRSLSEEAPVPASPHWPSSKAKKPLPASADGEKLRVGPQMSAAPHMGSKGALRQVSSRKLVHFSDGEQNNGLAREAEMGNAAAPALAKDSSREQGAAAANGDPSCGCSIM